MINMIVSLYSNDKVVKALMLAGLLSGLCALHYYVVASVIPAAVVIYYVVYAEESR